MFIFSFMHKNNTVSENQKKFNPLVHLYVLFGLLAIVCFMFLSEVGTDLVLASRVHSLFGILLVAPVIFIGYLVLVQYIFQHNLLPQKHFTYSDYILELKSSLFSFMYFYTLMFFILVYSLVGSQHRYGTVANFESTVVYKMSLLPIELTFYVDVLGLLFMGLSLLLIFLSILFLWPTMELEKNLILYVSQLFLLLTQLQMTFTASNLLTFFIAFESLLIPMIIMISIWGSPNRRQANNYLVFYTMVSAVPMLLAIIYMHQKFGTLDMTLLAEGAYWTWSEQFWLWLAFFFAFAVKTPMVPVHIWLPKAHVDAPTIGSVILAGLLLKVGLVGFIRIALPLFTEATHFFAPYVCALATIGVLYSSLITLRQIDMKRIIAYSSVAHMNMAVVSLCSLNTIGLYSSIYLMLSHGLIASGLFFLVGFLYNRFHVRTVAYFGGLATMMPVMTIVFFLFSLANMAFPFTSGFIGEFLLLLGITYTNFFLGFLNATSMLITTVYTMLLFGRVFLGELKPQFQSLMAQRIFHPESESISNTWLLKKFSHFDLYYYELMIASTLLSLIFWWGCYPQSLLKILLSSEYLYVISCNFL